MPGTRKPRQSENRRAAIYARVSDKSQAEDDKTSLAEQTGDMEAYCAERGYTITARYQEVGRGWSKQRPEFQRMLADARDGRFDTVVCWKSDRLSRGMYPAAALMEVVEAQRIDIEAVMDAVDMKTFGLMAAIGKIELDNFRERASMGKRGAAKQGRIPVNRVPFGYRITEEGAPAVDEEHAKVVRRIFREYVHEGMGGLAIAQRLTSEDVPTGGRASRWHAPQVNRILRNETYLGTWWYGKARHIATDDGTRIHEQPRDSWIGVPFPPLVDDEIWKQAQALRVRRRIRSSRNTKVFHLLQHLVRCSECGMLMGPIAKRRHTVRRGGKTYRYDFDTPRRYYQCYGMKAPHSLRCREHPMIRAERLETLVWGEVKRVLEHPDLIVAGLAALDGDADDDVAGEVARTERELASVQMEEDRAIRLYVTGKITEEQLDHQRRFIGERLERLRARLDEYRTRASAHADQRLVLERVVEWTQRVGDGLDDLPDEERRELLNLLLDEATIDGENNVTLTLAIPGDGDVVSIAEQGPPTTDHRPPITDHRASVASALLHCAGAAHPRRPRRRLRTLRARPHARARGARRDRPRHPQPSPSRRGLVDARCRHPPRRFRTRAGGPDSPRPGGRRTGSPRLRPGALEAQAPLRLPRPGGRDERPPAGSLRHRRAPARVRPRRLGANRQPSRVRDRHGRRAGCARSRPRRGARSATPRDARRISVRGIRLD